MSDWGWTLSLKQGGLTFGKKGVRLDVCHWEESEIIWVGLAMGPVIARVIWQSLRLFVFLFLLPRLLC